MKRAVLLLTLCALFAVCASPALAQKKTTSSCPADITNLTVTFANALGDLYTSDGVSASYTTTKTKGENIDIKFQQSNCTYDFTMNLNFSKRTTKLTLGGTTVDSEFFNFDRVGSVPVTHTATDFLSSQFCQNGWAIDPATGKPAMNPDGTVQDNYGGCYQEKDANGDPVLDANGKFIYYVLRSVGIQAGSDRYGFRYQYSPIENVATWAMNTSFIRVYRPGAKEWVLVPEVTRSPADGSEPCVTQGCTDASSLGRHQDKDTNTTLADYSVPFRITVKQN